MQYLRPVLNGLDEVGDSLESPLIAFARIKAINIHRWANFLKNTHLKCFTTNYTILSRKLFRTPRIKIPLKLELKFEGQSASNWREGSAFNHLFLCSSSSLHIILHGPKWSISCK